MTRLKYLWRYVIVMEVSKLMKLMHAREDTLKANEGMEESGS